MLPSISIVIATYKPENLLEELVRSLRQQQNFGILYEVEVIVVDSECSGSTKALCALNEVRYLENPNKDPVTAKYIGYKSASNNLVCFIDQDERFVSTTSLENRIKTFSKEENLCLYFSTGYQITPSMESSNIYTSLYGDPVSRFVYRTPNSQDRARALSKLLNWRVDNRMYFSCEKQKYRGRVLLEFGCMGATVNKKRLRQILGKEIDIVDFVHLFYLVLAHEKNRSIGVALDELILHKSSSDWSIIKDKIRWRILNTNGYSNTLAKSGISSRLELENKLLVGSHYRKPRSFQVIKILYLLSLVFPFIHVVDAIHDAFKYKRVGLIRQFHLNYFVVRYFIEGTVLKKLGNAG